MLDGFKRTVLVFAADRRLTNLDGSYGSTQQKLFQIPYLEGGISYFGLATVFPGGKAQHMADWLRNFINKHSGISSLRDCAFQLRDELHKVIPPDILGKHASGFHICGYNSQGIPEFWFLRNIGGMTEFAYTDTRPRYGEPTADFLERDAKTLGWDGSSLTSVENKTWFYRNGDFRAHSVAFERLDRVLADMLSFPDFKRLEKPDDLADWVRFKLEFVARFYKKYAKKQIIGTPIDAFCLTKTLP